MASLSTTYRSTIGSSVPRAQDITACLVGFEKHKARPDLGDDSGFWLRVNAQNATPFVAAFKNSPAVFQEFVIEERGQRNS
jgi:hypothetical protein